MVLMTMCPLSNRPYELQEPIAVLACLCDATLSIVRTDEVMGATLWLIVIFGVDIEVA